MESLSQILSRLVEGEVEFILIGGFAAVTHGVTRITRDVDVCCRFSPENLLRLQAALKPLNPRHRMTPAKLPLELTRGSCAGLKNLYLDTDLGVLDCLGDVAGIGDYDQALRDSKEVTAPWGKLRVLGIDALIRAKEAMDRPHDRETVRQLRAIKERMG